MVKMKKEIHVVDADGNRIRAVNRITHLRNGPKLKTFKYLPTRSNDVTTRDLEKLEDAIWTNKERRIEFLNLCTTLHPSIDKELDDYLATLSTRRFRALRHCWYNLKWRPSVNGSEVLINPTNIYRTRW